MELAIRHICEKMHACCFGTLDWPETSQTQLLKTPKTTHPSHTMALRIYLKQHIFRNSFSSKFSNCLLWCAPAGFVPRNPDCVWARKKCIVSGIWHCRQPQRTLASAKHTRTHQTLMFSCCKLIARRHHVLSIQFSGGCVAITAKTGRVCSAGSRSDSSHQFQSTQTHHARECETTRSVIHLQSGAVRVTSNT